MSCCSEDTRTCPRRFWSRWWESFRQRARVGQDAWARHRAFPAVQRREVVQAPGSREQEDEGIVTRATYPGPARALADARSGVVRPPSRAAVPASSQTSWACTGTAMVGGASVADAAAACWHCHWAQRLQACEASGGCYCGRRTTSEQNSRRGVAAVWAAGSACH